jgi:hypothetical protein
MLQEKAGDLRLVLFGSIVEQRFVGPRAIVDIDARCGKILLFPSDGRIIAPFDGSACDGDHRV